MAKRRVTKIDPRKELSPYINHQSTKNKRKKNTKVSASLSNLHAERRRSLFRRLGSIVVISLIAIIGLGYYVSPLANIGSVRVEGADDLSSKAIVASSGIKASDKVFDYLFNQKSVNNKLVKKYLEIKSVNIKLSHFNQLTLQVKEYSTLGYLKVGNKYRKILANDKLGTRAISWSKADQDKPIFIGTNHESSLKEDLKLFNSFPASFKKEVKVLSGNTRRKSQIILVMKDGNVVIGNITTLKDKIKYYNAIKEKAGKNSLIDLEIGAFSRPLTSSEKRAYDIT